MDCPALLLGFALGLPICSASLDRLAAGFRVGTMDHARRRYPNAGPQASTPREGGYKSHIIMREIRKFVQASAEL